MALLPHCIYSLTWAVFVCQITLCFSWHNMVWVLAGYVLKRRKYCWEERLQYKADRCGESIPALLNGGLLEEGYMQSVLLRKNTHWRFIYSQLISWRFMKPFRTRSRTLLPVGMIRISTSDWGKYLTCPSYWSVLSSNTKASCRQSTRICLYLGDPWLCSEFGQTLSSWLWCLQNPVKEF